MDLNQLARPNRISLFCRIKVVVFNLVQSEVCYILSANVDSELSLHAVANRFLVPFSFFKYIFWLYLQQNSRAYKFENY